ncbi:MAG TPA: RNA polymerase sigma factor [Candidatus Baltobacteraceae bacterium]|jgi:RNA polymerase sigma factor (sigma-70 family)|nr:RNA polymerase sigma factor [Candidatus Baltobacteraceae bacterium]
MSADVHRTIEAIWRMESAKLIAGIARMVRDVGVAEEVAQDALVTALEKWPHTGIPDNPAAWLTRVARMRAIDRIRRNDRLQRLHPQILRDLDAVQHDWIDAPQEEVQDDLLRLMFIACHPVLSPDARVALTLRLLGGLSTEEIARAFLVPVKTVAQRIVRAKRTLYEARVPFELPPAAQRAARLSSVLEAVYLIFNEGYSPTAGQTWIRPQLCEDALRLGRILAELTPQEPEVHGLVALMELQASRLRARTGPSGEPVLLLEQDRGRWDHLLIRRGLTALRKAERLGEPLGPYTIQAAIASVHAQAHTPQETDWQRILALYDALVALMPSPIVELNRAIAVSMAFGPQAGLDLIDAIAADPALRLYHLLPSVRGDLLVKLGRYDAALTELERALSMTQNEGERLLLSRRISALKGNHTWN